MGRAQTPIHGRFQPAHAARTATGGMVVAIRGGDVVAAALVAATTCPTADGVAATPARREAARAVVAPAAWTHQIDATAGGQEEGLAAHPAPGATMATGDAVAKVVLVPPCQMEAA